MMQIFAVCLFCYSMRVGNKQGPEPNEVVIACCYRPEARWLGSPRIKSSAHAFPHNTITTLTLTEMQNAYIQQSNKQKANDTRRKSISLHTKILRWTYILERIIGFLSTLGAHPNMDHIRLH